MKNKRFIWFDLGYTLMFNQREKVYQKFLEEKSIEIPLELIEDAYHSADKIFMREYPGVLNKNSSTFYPWYLAVVNYQLGIRHNLVEQSEKIRKWEQEVENFWTPFHCTIPVLDQLKSRDYKIGLISNWDLSARKLLEKFKLNTYFENIIISSEVGIEKPRAEIFHTALNLANVSSEESIYIGDNYYDDVIGSSRVGMQSILINRFGKKGIEEINHDSVISSIEELPQLLEENVGLNIN